MSIYHNTKSNKKQEEKKTITKMDLPNAANGVYIVMRNNVRTLFEIKVIFCDVVILLILPVSYCCLLFYKLATCQYYFVSKDDKLCFWL